MRKLQAARQKLIFPQTLTKLDLYQVLVLDDKSRVTYTDFVLKEALKDQTDTQKNINNINQ